MANFLAKLFDGNAKEIKRYEKLVEKINAREDHFAAMTDEELREHTPMWKKQVAEGASVNDLLVDAFALVREASKRVLGMRHFDVQLIGGMVMHDGRIAEMKTGEGKTLMATCPVYLNALTGKGVHVITVNEYLATRDSQTMGKLYKFLGLSVGLITTQMNPLIKKLQYICDITYGTNNEFGFDYLRDNMSVSKPNQVQKPLHFAIVDEVDSILIDEARTPLIISGPAEKPAERYFQMAQIVTRLVRETDFTIDEKAKAVILTPEGLSKVEKMTGVENLYDNVNTEINHYVQQALKAQFLFKVDRDYVIKDGEIVIVDEFTGRLMFGRRYSEGLHQAIEAKERVDVKNESQTLASVTFQNYFRMYQKIAGMTGTAMTEEDEFRSIYGLDVVAVPTNKPIQRIDMPDTIYRTEMGKFHAVINSIVEKNATGQPVLVGTVSIEKSELLSRMLKQKGVKHQVLNAKFHEQEAEIIADAGRFGAVTIATNMAGRGTDIMLGGGAEFRLRKLQMQHPEKEWTLEEEQQYIAQFENEVKDERGKVLAAGGLAIIGTERHESRRIDNQLRGRAGRQGDQGTSQFFLSMDDDLIRRFGGEGVVKMMDKMGMDDTMPIEAKVVSRAIESAQKKVEARNFEIRKSVLEYDNVMNQQRKLIYEQRQSVLEDANLHESVLFMLKSAGETIVERNRTESNVVEEWNTAVLLNEIDTVAPNHGVTEEELCKMAGSEVAEFFNEKAVAHMNQRIERMGEDIMNRLERVVILKAVDAKWMDHIDAMDQLRQGIGYRAMGQQNPVTEYKKEAFLMFEGMISDIQMEVSRLIQRVEVAEKPKERTNIVASHGGEAQAPKKPVPVVKNSIERMERNDLCHCGSGKKFKNCCGAKKDGE